MAYTVATLVLKDPPQADGRVLISVDFSGAGETTVRRTLLVGPSDTAQSIRRWAIETAKSLGDVKTIASTLTVGQSINLAAITPPAPTAEEVWRSKVDRYRSLADLGLTGQAATDLAALKTEIQNTYLSAYL